MHMRRVWPAGQLVPVVSEHRPEGLIEPLPIRRGERLAQHAFLHCTELQHRGLAATVGHRGAGFEAMHAELVEREIEEQTRGVEEQPRAPVPSGHRHALLGDAKPRLELPELQQTDR